MRRFFACICLVAISFSLCSCGAETGPPSPRTSASLAPSGSEEIGEPLYAAAPSALDAKKEARRGIVRDPVVVHDCRLSFIDKQEVPSQREGVILFIGTEISPGETVPPERLVSVRTPDGIKQYRQLQEGDRVEPGQLLAQLDDRLARDELLIRSARVASAQADLAASEKTRDEAKMRFDTQAKLLGTRATSSEEARAANLTWNRFQFEAMSKLEASRLTERERNQAQTVLEMHQLRSSIPGMIKTVYKNRGEAVRALEPVFHINDLSRLRIEGLLKVENLDRVRPGMRVVVEPTRSQGPEQTLLGHLQEITAVAVGSEKENIVIVSASEDGSVRIWDRSSPYERCVLWHPAAVRAVACSPPSSSRMGPNMGSNLCLTGCADGIARLYTLDGDSDQPVRSFADAHQGPISCVAFSPDGKSCVTGGEDREIALWDPATGELRYRFPAGHRAAVTSVQFTPGGQLVSAGRDNTICVWALGTKGARLASTIDRRSGEVTCPGVSPDGKHVIFDQGPALQLLTLKDRLTEGVLFNPGEATQFTNFALFSPDGRSIITAGAAQGRVQLWRAPTPTSRPYELRQFVSHEHSQVSCAAFSPDGTFVVTGTKDRQVLLWPMPAAKEVELQVTATLTLVERAVDSSSHHVRIWAEVANESGRLVPGTSVTLAIYP